MLVESLVVPRGAMVDPDCYTLHAWDSRALPWLK